MRRARVHTRREKEGEGGRRGRRGREQSHSEREGGGERERMQETKPLKTGSERYEDAQQQRPAERAGVKQRRATGCCLCGFGSRRACCLCCWSTFLLVAGLLVFLLWPRALLPLARLPAGDRRSLYRHSPSPRAQRFTLTG